MLRNHYSERLLVKRLSRRLFAIEFNAQMMRCDAAAVNEMEFRMLRARRGLCPRSKTAMVKGFWGWRAAFATAARAAAGRLRAGAKGKPRRIKQISRERRSPPRHQQLHMDFAFVALLDHA
jgi:hypothetical protein